MGYDLAPATSAAPAMLILFIGIALYTILPTLKINEHFFLSKLALLSLNLFVRIQMDLILI